MEYFLLFEWFSSEAFIFFTFCFFLYSLFKGILEIYK